MPYDSKSISHSFCLFFLTNFLCTSRTCRKSTYINNVTALLHNLSCSFQNFTLSLLSASDIKTVGSAVKNSHYFGSRKVHQPSMNINCIVYMFHTMQSYHIFEYYPN